MADDERDLNILREDPIEDEIAVSPVPQFPPSPQTILLSEILEELKGIRKQLDEIASNQIIYSG